MSRTDASAKQKAGRHEERSPRAAPTGRFDPASRFSLRAAMNHLIPDRKGGKRITSGIGRKLPQT
jgi:hypothetical protein